MTNPDLAAIIASELGVQASNVASALALLEEGNTVPFIARYRKEATGGLDDTQLRTIDQRSEYLRELEQRKATIIAAIEEQGKLTDALRREIQACETKARLEDLYLPYKKRRKTKADTAREQGLEPLLEELLEKPAADPEALAQPYLNETVASTKEALDGARAILIDRFATNADVVGEVRDVMYRTGTMRSSVVPGKETEGAKYRDYFDFSEPFESLPSHRILALLRGESEGVLSLELDPGETEYYEHLIAKRCELDMASPWIARAVSWGWKTKLLVSSGLDVRMRLKEAAEQKACEVFANNLRDVLLAAPAGQRTTLGLDPGYRNGVKCAVVNATGKVLETFIVYPHKPQQRWEEAQRRLATCCAQHRVELIAVGNGTASRETEKLARSCAKLVGEAGGAAPTTVVVSESGASVYSASELAAKEFPEMDVSLRGAVSIARRLQDPLAELVKIDPKAIGVGQYQHDVNQQALATALDAVVEDAVNAVGVDANTASVALLARVAGITPTLANNIVTYRDEHGAYTDRKQLLDVPRLGPKAYEQAAGFLRIRGTNPLDASAVHPEAYPVVNAMAQAKGCAVDTLIGNRQALASIRPEAFVDEHFGVPTITDILQELQKPGRDPRPEFRTANFQDGVNTVEDLAPGMVLEGTVTNVAAFGAFVDVGVHQDGLVHISQLASHFIADPHEVVRSGQVVRVQVLEVDVERQRISLTMRTDDDERQGSGRPRPQRGQRTSGERTGKSGRGRKPNPKGRQQGRARQASQPESAMAAALRRAGRR